MASVKCSSLIVSHTLCIAIETIENMGHSNQLLHYCLLLFTDEALFHYPSFWDITSTLVPSIRCLHVFWLEAVSKTKHQSYKGKNAQIWAYIIRGNRGQHSLILREKLEGVMMV